MLHSWGRGKDGRLGHADGSADHSEPRAVEALADIPLELVALGNCHGGAVTSTGEVYMWGGGAFGGYRGGDGGALGGGGSGGGEYMKHEPSSSVAREL